MKGEEFAKSVRSSNEPICSLAGTQSERKGLASLKMSQDVSSTSELESFWSINKGCPWHVYHLVEPLCFKLLSKPDRQSLQSRAGYRVEQVDLPHLRAIAEPLRLSKESGMGCSKMCRLLVQLGARIARHALHMRKAHAQSTCKLCQCKASQLRTQSGFKFRFFTRPEGKEGLRAISQGKRRRGQDSAGLRWTPLSLEIHWISIGFPLANWSRSSPLEQAGCETSRTARRNG